MNPWNGPENAHIPQFRPSLERRTLSAWIASADGNGVSFGPVAAWSAGGTRCFPIAHASGVCTATATESRCLPLSRRRDENGLPHAKREGGTREGVPGGKIAL